MSNLTEQIQPRSGEDVTEAVRWAAGTRTALELIAGGTKRALGGLSERAAELRLDGLAGIVSYEPEELVLCARPGTLLRDIEAALAAANQMLAFEPPDWAGLLDARAGAATLGGTVACNASGPRRMRAGAARDHMLGVSAVSGRGEAFKAGGKVVKNVTGYDLPKLLAGSFGTLAVITELTVKVLPRPEAACTVVLPGLADGAAIDALRNAASLPYEASGLAHLPAGAAARLGFPWPATLIRLEGTAATLPHRLEGMIAALGVAGAEVLSEPETVRSWAALRDVAALVDGAEIVWRVSVPPGSGPGIAAGFGADKYFYDWAGGLLWLGGNIEQAETRTAELRAATAPAAGGHATLFRAPPALRARIPVFEPEPAPLAVLSRRVKAAFDPLGVLNPGRLMPIS